MESFFGLKNERDKEAEGHKLVHRLSYRHPPEDQRKGAPEAGAQGASGGKGPQGCQKRENRVGNNLASH
jgi:hypothetical protein